MVGDGHTGREVEVAEFGAELAEADAGGICDLSAAIQIQMLYVTTILCKSPAKDIHKTFRFGTLKSEFY